MVFGPPFLIAGVVLWSGITLSGYCRRSLKWPWGWNGSVHNYDGRRAPLPGLLLGTGAFLLTLGAAAACADVAWLHPLAWLLTGVAFAVGAFAAAYLFVYPWVNLPK